MARDRAALSLTADCAEPLGLRDPAVLAELARQAEQLAGKRGITGPEEFYRAVHDVLFGSARWRREVGYDHPMDGPR
ncbi:MULTISPECIES: hypothetical protein [Kitasatospora]|uniref:hypothetical protein n=1 Tax=Kitasatospora TaxID=2063 RepID=UPI000C703A0E|nr:hypothetical protein [Kitasatospora sp. GP30]MDH6139338.1 hypothetical protein [Kitasatospora sp. GP30]